MYNLEPTYLRYIYDGLIKGSIHPENAAELPEGLIGLYEEAFDEKQPVYIRQQLLERFAIWALVKKEVSAQFIAEVLNQSEEDIQEFIATYSAWFNSPESGKYQLYHERLKVYLLQKLSEGEVHALHEKLISRLEQVIEEQKVDEFEWYGLEFLTQHYAVNAMLHGDGILMLDLAYNQKHWQRQLKISKGYIWTKSALHSVMNWASKYNDDEVIECGLQLVDLHHQEQNAAPQIVALVAEGDFDSALKRIEQFGGNDKEGLQRKFILYMLCLMELTLLESRNKPSRKEGIEKILKHLDEQLPVDHSVLNWREFLPTNLMFKIECEIRLIHSYTFTLFKFTDQWDLDWITEKSRLSFDEVELLIELAEQITDVFWSAMRLIELGKYCLKSIEQIEIANRLFTKAIGLAEDYHGDLRDNLLKSIVHSFIEIGNEKLAKSVMLLFERGSKDQIDVAIKFVTAFSEPENLVDLINVYHIEEEISKINNEYEKYLAISDLAVTLSKSNLLDEAIKLSEQILDFPRIKINTLNGIAFSAIKNNQSSYFNQLQDEILNELIQIDDQWELDITYSELIDTFLTHNDPDRSRDLIDKIQDDYWKNQAILKIANYQLFKAFELESAQALLSTLPINSDEQIEGVLNISAYLVTINKLDLAEAELSKLWFQISKLEDHFSKNASQSKCLQFLFSLAPSNLAPYLNQILIINKGIADLSFKRSILHGVLQQSNDQQKEVIIDILLSLHLEKNNFRAETFFEEVRWLTAWNVEDWLLNFSETISDFQLRSDFLRILLKSKSFMPSKQKELESNLISLSDQIQNTYWKLHSKIQNLEYFNQFMMKDLVQIELSNIENAIPDLPKLLQAQVKINLACQFIRANQKDKGNYILDEIKKALPEFSEEDQNRINQQLSLAFLDLGAENAAFETLNKVAEQADQFVSLSLNSKNETRYEFVKIMISTKSIQTVRAFINEISNPNWKDKSLALVLKYYIQNEDLSNAFTLSNEFNTRNHMLKTWWDSGYQLHENKSITISSFESYDNQELIPLKYYISGAAHRINFNELTFENLKCWITRELNNPEQYKVLLTKYAIKKLFSTQASEHISRYNHVLNFQWAIDIKNQLSN